jgi:Alcohol dehydrogenase GroES-like domain
VATVFGGRRRSSPSPDSKRDGPAPMTRSVRIRAFGDADILRIEDIVTGEPGVGEVRLRVHAIGLNRTEVTLRSGRSPVKPALPSSIGFEAAGIIEGLGPDVSGFAVGDRVALIPAYGTAEYALYGEASFAPARSLVATPDHVSFSEAAATWVAYGTAWGGLVAIGTLAGGQTVLIPAASSGLMILPVVMHLATTKATRAARQLPFNLPPPKRIYCRSMPPAIAGRAVPRRRSSPSTTPPKGQQIEPRRGGISREHDNRPQLTRLIHRGRDFGLADVA